MKILIIVIINFYDIKLFSVKSFLLSFYNQYTKLSLFVQYYNDFL